MKNSFWIFIPLLIVSCIKTEQVSPIPEITFKKYTLGYELDTSLDNILLIGTLEFSFIDGDADIGIDTATANNSKLPDSVRYNIFLFPYEKLDGRYIPIVFDTNVYHPPSFYTIKENDKLERSGQYKTIKGEIKLKMNDLPIGYDTIRYEFFIRDRVGNKSNVEVTNNIGLKGITKPD